MLFLKNHTKEIAKTINIKKIFFFDTSVFLLEIYSIFYKTTISIYSLSQKSCEIKMNYKFYLNGWRKILRPFLKKLIPIWNNKVWLEDLPIKHRREKVKRLNFKHFYGLPDDLNDRNYD